jgi:DNA sulfur modification protein DndC
MHHVVDEARDQIRQQYIANDGNKPWVVAFSGGKDSTLLLRLVWEALLSLDRSHWQRPISVICNDTLVENPEFQSLVVSELEQIRKQTQLAGVPMTLAVTTPSLGESFWVNLIGRGYVAPNRQFRWCTDRLKIQPTNLYIETQVSRHGEVIVLIGTRLAESGTRARSMNRHHIPRTGLSQHRLPGAYAFAPLRDVQDDDVWGYLQHSAAPWCSDHSTLASLYQRASEPGSQVEEDLLTMSLESAPRGGSRFGCWVCTLIEHDHSMNHLIDSGSEWMTPLRDFRNLLYSTIDRKSPQYSPEQYRMPVRRNTQDGLGPYWPSFRQLLLRQLLTAQECIRRTHPEVCLVSEQELAAIQVIWDRDMLFESSVQAQRPTSAVSRTAARYSNAIAGTATLEMVCKEHGHPEHYELLCHLLKASRGRLLLARGNQARTDQERVLREFVEPRMSDVYKLDRGQ